MSIINRITAVDAAPSLKESIFSEVKLESQLSETIGRLEEEMIRLEDDIKNLCSALYPILKPGSIAPDFEGNDLPSLMARIEDLRNYVTHQKARIQAIIRRIDL